MMQLSSYGLLQFSYKCLWKCLKFEKELIIELQQNSKYISIHYHWFKNRYLIQYPLKHNILQTYKSQRCELKLFKVQGSNVHFLQKYKHLYKDIFWMKRCNDNRRPNKAASING